MATSGDGGDMKTKQKTLSRYEFKFDTNRI
jgi:hypothetical protein